MVTFRTTSTLAATPRAPTGPRPSRAAVEERAWHLLSIREVASACQLSEKAVRRAIDDGELLAVKLRSRLRVTPQDLAAWIDSARQLREPATLQPCRRPRRRPAEGTFRAMVPTLEERGAKR
jgi:excisionase family DNA binding protein